MAPPAKKHKGPSAYMIFAEEQRPGLLVKLRAESADGKVPVTVVAKALGELWKSLPETEQQSYRDKAQQRAVDAAAAAEGTSVGRHTTHVHVDQPGSQQSSKPLSMYPGND